MAIEIERKFLVQGFDWLRSVTKCARIEQFYISVGDSTSTRVRIKNGQDALLCIKQAKSTTERLEFEVPIDLKMAQDMREMMLGVPVIKTRYNVPARYITGTSKFTGEINEIEFEIDVFDGANKPLVLAEIELPSPNAPYPAAPWLAREVTDDDRFLNVNLALNPISSWQNKLELYSYITPTVP